ncbi:alpha/beta fold hydrolase [Mucilaginibacter gotjawali]|uniref:Pimeloyl-ACP methyl ester carboxylesterase n=2 Tax=Mucilaginibacter gotjawali TaxID=1550579 RepID=A0A839SKP3_9SPHI|nr:alpha/beta hydrolase [Mucilaginibacter gotjawali]MBB3058456.1 pimeloyl-ACP methyl ester carboxylesterase [Mucilaginibacter gotjawali]BAU53715.1 Tripeptidyl aminopeptidase precursor [Mucilaginibacter gotjawali]
MKYVYITSLLLSITISSFAQNKGYTPKTEPCACAFKADTAYHTQCAYLIVPENRSKPQGRKIKLPFIIVESKNPDKKKDPVLFSAGGPGLSTLHYAKSITRRSLLKNRDYIAFEQRGTDYAIPNLNIADIGAAAQKGYREHLSTDSMALDAIKKGREKLVKQGIDLSAYNTDESAADIEDLRIALKIDSLNLMGISYSGGLMMTVLNRYPKHIRSLILDSPLPEFVNIDEEELTNFNEVIDQVISPDLKERFHRYFTAMDGKKFTIDYLEKGKMATERLYYGRSELLAILHSYAEDYDKIKEIPKFLEDVISGHQEPYIKTYFDDVFSGNGGASGMRFSVYCSDKLAYASPAIIKQQDEIQPWLAGFHVNDVYLSISKVWQVKPIKASTKKPFYSNIPALLGAGGMDDSCRPIYNDLIHHYMPNSQRILFSQRQHGPLLNSRDGDEFIGHFLDHPFGKLSSDNKEIVVY